MKVLFATVRLCTCRPGEKYEVPTIIETKAVYLISRNYSWIYLMLLIFVDFCCLDEQLYQY